MRIDVLTIFPELFEPFVKVGMVDQSRRKRLAEIRITDLRGFTEDRHGSVDDRPYGGGPGMLIKPEPVFRALEILLGDELDRILEGSESETEWSTTERSKTVRSKTVLVLLCPQGERLEQAHLAELAECERLVCLCGRYEGFDERIVDAFPWRRVSIGDFVLSGGEIPTMALIEGVTRLIPGVLGHAESAVRDSFAEWPGPNGYDHPHYTRPEDYRGQPVPEVLLSGHHGEIEAWRRAARKTRGES